MLSPEVVILTVLWLIRLLVLLLMVVCVCVGGRLAVGGGGDRGLCELVVEIAVANAREELGVVHVPTENGGQDSGRRAGGSGGEGEKRTRPSEGNTDRTARTKVRRERPAGCGGTWRAQLHHMRVFFSFVCALCVACTTRPGAHRDTT